MKTLSSILALSVAAWLALPLAATAADDATVTCEKSASDRKLAGAARASHIKKCVADAGTAASANPACEKSASDKKLAGAARTSHIKKCTADMAAKKAP
jgi:hypothetical protein